GILLCKLIGAVDGPLLATWLEADGSPYFSVRSLVRSSSAGRSINFGLFFSECPPHAVFRRPDPLRGRRHTSEGVKRNSNQHHDPRLFGNSIHRIECAILIIEPEPGYRHENASQQQITRRRPSCSRAMRRGGSRRTSPSCPTYCARIEPYCGLPVSA